MKRLYELNGFEYERLWSLHPPKYWAKHKWKYHYLITAILNKMLFGKQNKYGTYKLSSEVLRNTFGQVRLLGQRRWAYMQLREDLISLGVISCHTLPDDRLRNQGLYREVVYYSLNQEMLDSGWKRLNLDARTKRILEVADEKPAIVGVYKQIEKSLRNVTIQSGARKYADLCLKYHKPLRDKKNGYVVIKNRSFNQQVHSCWNMIIDKIEDREWNLIVDFGKTERVFHPITNLPKELRPFLRLNGKKLVELDLANSQPTIFISYLLNWCHLNNVSTQEPDIQNYISLCQGGIFYSEVLRLIKEKGMDADVKPEQFKTDFFAKVFFSSERRVYNWRKVFNESFPNVSMAITAAKQDHHSNLAIMLQKIESEYMIGSVCQSLYSKGITEFFPLHDAIYCTHDIADEVHSQMINSAADFGIRPTIRMKELVSLLCCQK